MDIPTQLLGKFKCSRCENFLRQAPVYLQHNGAGVCGLCFTTETPATRDHYYENAARLLRFPCKYSEQGCTTRVPFVDEEEEVPHEHSCPFRKYVCPVLGSSDCNWLGSRDLILSHCREQHADHVVKNPVTLTHNIIKSNERTFLLVAFELLFLLHTKVCVTTGKIFHAVRFLGDSAKAEDFTFCVDVKREQCSLSRPGTVAPQGCLSIKQSISVALSINSLLDVLGGFSDTTFTITVKQTASYAKCQFEQLFEKYTSHKTDYMIQCEGCIYNNNDSKYEKHKWLFCTTTKKCPICRNSNNISENTLTLHYITSHKQITNLGGTTWHAPISLQNYQWRVIQSDVGTAVCRYWWYGPYFAINVHMPIDNYGQNNFRCTVRIHNTGTFYSRRSRLFTPDLFCTDWVCDWRVVIKKREFPWFKYGLDVTVDITEI